MALPPWTFELLRRGITDVARKAGEPETIEKLKTSASGLKNQAAELLQDFPESAARGLDRVLRSAEGGKDQVAKWARKHTSLSLPMLNASGVLLNEFGMGVPVADRVLDAGYDVLRGDVLSGTVAAERINKRLQRLAVLSEGRSIAIASNFSAAISALSLIADDRVLVVHRSQAVRLGGTVSLPDALGGLIPVVQEVGAIDDFRVSDFDALDAFCSIVADAGDVPVEILNFGERNAKQAVVLPVGSVVANKSLDIPAASTLLDAGADLVIVPGNGMCGGPECGLIIGVSELVNEIQNSASWPAMRATDAVAAMMCVALELHESKEDSPLDSLISTSEENLRARAERLATRLGGCDEVASTQITNQDARLAATGRWVLPSRQVSIKHQSLSASELQEKLKDSLPAILTAISDDGVVIDLRWLAPAEDTKVAECFG